MSNGGPTTVPPSSLALAAVSSALSTETYEFQVGGAPWSRIISGCGAIAATSLPSMRAIE